MTESGEIYDQNRIDFLHRVQAVKSEIRTKFQNLRNTIDNHELTILEKVEGIQHEILENYERALTSLKEISQVRDQVLAGLKSNASNDFLKKNLEMYDREIETVKKNSKIDSIFELVWSMEHLDLCDLCEVVSYSGNPNPEVSPVPISRDNRHEELLSAYPGKSPFNPYIPSHQMLPQPAFPDDTSVPFLSRPWFSVNAPSQTLQPTFPSNTLVQPAFSTAPLNKNFSLLPRLIAPKYASNQTFFQRSFSAALKDAQNQTFSQSSFSAALKDARNQTFSQSPLFTAPPNPTISQSPLFTAPPNPTISQSPLFTAPPNPTISQSPFLTAQPNPTISQSPFLTAPPNPTISQSPFFTAPKAPPN